MQENVSHKIKRNTLLKKGSKQGTPCWEVKSHSHHSHGCASLQLMSLCLFPNYLIMIPALDLLYLCTSLLFYMLVCLLFHPFFFFRNSVSPSQVLHLTPLQLFCHVANTVTASGAASRLTLRSLFISESSREQRHKRTHVLGHHPRSCSRLQSFAGLLVSLWSLFYSWDLLQRHREWAPCTWV